jgi:hypothetical protein
MFLDLYPNNLTKQHLPGAVHPVQQQNLTNREWLRLQQTCPKASAFSQSAAATTIDSSLVSALLCIRLNVKTSQ